MKLRIKKYLPLLVLVFTFTFSSCTTEDFNLSKSVFIEDYDAPNLPIYSEWGYNTFGMYIDRNVFVSSEQEFPAKIIVNPDTLKLYLNGSMNNQPTTLKIAIIGYAPNDYSELISLNDTIINLKSTQCIVSLEADYQTKVLDIIEGNIHFKRAQNLYVDKEFVKTILSGTINFKTFFDAEPVAITKGRFDLGIGYENFYNF